MSDQAARIPTSEELEKLPKWARVAFAARCARRVQPHFKLGWAAAPAQHIDAIERAIISAEASARSGIADPSVVGAAADANAAANANAYAPARAAAYAAAAAADTANAAPTAASNIIAAANAAYAFPRDTSAIVGKTATRADYSLVVRLAHEQRWTDESPVDPDLLGSLWPDGEPGWWPTQAKTADSAPPSMVLEFTVPADADQDDVDAKIAELLGHLSQLHRAHGGSGLVIHEGLAFKPAHVLVPCGPEGDGGGE